MAVERLAEDPAVLQQGLGVRLRAELVEQVRRTFDVGEQEGDGPRGKVAAHGTSWCAEEALLSRDEPRFRPGRLRTPSPAGGCLSAPSRPARRTSLGGASTIRARSR